MELEEGTTRDTKHRALVFWGDWHVFPYCLTCDWQGPSTNLYYGNSGEHQRNARRHEKKMNRWWRQLLARTKGATHE